MKHLAKVFMDTHADNTVTVEVQCDHCPGVKFTMSTAHVETLVRVFTDLMKVSGIEPAGRTDLMLVVEQDGTEVRQATDELFERFKRARNAEKN